MPQKEEDLKKEIERLKKELEELKKKVPKEKEEEVISKEKLVELIDETEQAIKKAFSVIENTIIGALEGAKKSLKSK
ncbi:MAG: ATP-dependent protease [Aquificae bacterium]|nr:ATP-dependent protease [Aquificota bacterium]